MAETLGSLCDKLTIIKLKQWHTDDPTRLESLALQARQLQDEVDQFVCDAFVGVIPVERLAFAANKVFKAEGNIVAEVSGDIGSVFAQLATVNCKLWHEQEKVYEFEKVAPAAKDAVVKQLAVLNLERNKCIDRIDSQFRAMVQKVRKTSL